MIRPRPLVRQPKKQRLSKGKSMSISIATVCTDGLVVCADREISGYGFKFYECKLSKISLDADSRALVLAYVGSSDTMKVIVQDLRNRIEGKHKSREEIEAALQETVNASLPQKPEGDEEHHAMLCGFCADENFVLLKTWDRKISPVSAWDCVGVGDSALTRYLGAIFLGTQIHLPVFRAVPICNYMIAQAKKYVQGCGGETDLFVMDPSGKVTEQLTGPVIDKICELIEYNFNLLLTSATEPDVSAEQYDNLIKQLRGLTGMTTKVFQGFLGQQPKLEKSDEPQNGS